MAKWQWILKQFSKKLWVRTSLFSVGAALTAVVALIFKDFIPEDISRKVGAEAVDGILHIIANSMLAVAIFSLSTMVAAYSAATAHVTPRSTKLLLEDNTSQNALSTFIGSFLFSLVGIIALSMGIYGESGRLILFAVTIVVIIVIITVLIRWVNYLSELGRVGKTIDMVEKVAARAMNDRLEHPYLDGRPLKDFEPAANLVAVVHPTIGYVSYIDMPALSELAEAENCDIFIRALPGSFNDGSKPIAYLSKALEDSKLDVLRDAYSLDDDRTFEQDPRFGMIVLSEIASRALSTGINDPGTAIDIIGTSVRVLMPWVQPRPEPDPDAIKYQRVHVPAISTADLFDDIFTAIARDGAGIVEVGIRLQKALRSLSNMGDEETKTQARRHSELAFERAKHALTLEDDIKRLEALII